MARRRSRALSGAVTLAVIVAVAGAAGTFATAQSAPAATPATGGDGQNAGIWKGVFSAPQAERGKGTFTGLCRRCHADDLTGSRRGPALRGESFISHWEAQDLRRMFDKIRDTMPPDNPGSLTDDEYLDVMTYVLQANDFPVGTEELTPEATEDVLVMRKMVPGEPPREAQNFSVVQVVGCLTQGPDNMWVLTNTSEPVLTRDRPSSPEELKAALARPLGHRTFRLVSVARFTPESHQGQKVEAKGLIYRAPNKDRLNLSSLQMVASTCEG